VGEFAAKTAIGLGASVKVLITHHETAVTKQFNQRFFTPPYNQIVESIKTL
jgi:hypothetical protein